MLESDYITEDDIRRDLARELGVPFINLQDYNIDPKTLSLIPEPIAREHNVIAFNKQGNQLEVAMLNLADLEHLSWLEIKAGLKILPRLTSDKSIKSALVAYRQILKTEFGDRLKKDLTGPEALEMLLGHANLQRASHIHLEPAADSCLVRYRLNGSLYDAMVLTKDIVDKFINELKRVESDDRFTYTVGENKTVVHLRAEHTKGFSLEGLGMKAEDVELVYKKLRQLQGLLLITGKAKSGKTTTLYTILDLLNVPEVSIVTVEDPIEYQLPRVSQVAVNRELGLSAADILKNITKQDPDIIAIGEITDSATAKMACSLATTNRLVLATMTADSPQQAIEQLLEAGVSEQQLAKSLSLIIAQKLTPDPLFEVLPAGELY